MSRTPRPLRKGPSTRGCYDCGQPANPGRRVWLKDQGIERKLCVSCLEKRGLHLLARPAREGASS